MFSQRSSESLPFKNFAIFFLILLLFTVSCSEEIKRPFDPKTGIVSKDLKLDPAVLAPFEVKVDTKYTFYYMEDHLAFISDPGQPERFATVHLGRGIQDNKYLRAERDFSGFYFDGSSMAGLAYTKERHDSTKLSTSYPYYTFGGLTWEQAYSSGEFKYDRRGVKFELEFDQLQPVQYFGDRDWRLRVNAFGRGKLIANEDTVTGLVFYELLQLDGYNPIEQVNRGVDYVNYDWIALRTESGKQLLVSTDSSTANDLLMKNFLALDKGDVIWFADGSDNVDMISSEVLRDRKIHDWLANKKHVDVPGLGVSIDLRLTDRKVFYTSGYAIAVVEGTLSLDGSEEGVWGIMEHRQQPGTTSEAIK